jgi:hypothetical protein
MMQLWAVGAKMMLFCCQCDAFRSGYQCAIPAPAGMGILLMGRNRAATFPKKRLSAFETARNSPVQQMITHIRNVVFLRE